MSWSQPVSNSGGPINDALLNFIENHRKESSKKAKLTSAMRMAGLNPDKNKKPTDYKASDFFPPLPQEVTLENPKKNLALKDIGNNNQTKARKSLHGQLISTNNEKSTTTPLNAATETTSNTREDTLNSNASKSKLINKSTTAGTSNNNSSSLQPIASINLNNSLNISHTINDDFDGEQQQKQVTKENKENTNLQQTSRVSDRRKSVTKTDPQLPAGLTHLIDESNTNKTPQLNINDNVSTNKFRRRSLATSLAAQTPTTPMDDEHIGEEEKERRTQPEITDAVYVLPIGENAQVKRISIIDPRLVPAESDSEDEDDINSASQKLIKQQQSRSIASKANEVEVKEKTTRVQKNLSSTLKISETGKSPKANTSRLEDGEDVGKTPLRQEFNNSLKKRRSHNLSQISEGSENKHDNENEDEVFDLNEEEFIEIHGIEEEQIVTTALAKNNKNLMKNKNQTIEQTHVSISITSKSKSPVSKDSTSKKSPLLPSPPPPPPPPPVVAEVTVKKGSSITISKRKAPPPPPQQAFETQSISHSQPPSTSNSGIGKLTKSISSSSISSQPTKKMTSHASLRNLEEANDSKDDCELQALNSQLLRRSMTRSINRTGNSTVSNSSVNTAAVNGGASQSASHLFKPKLAAQANTKPMPPLFNSEINKSTKTKNDESKLKPQKTTNSSETHFDHYEFHNEMPFDSDDNRQTSSRASRSRTRRTRDSNSETPTVAVTSSVSNLNAKSSKTSTTASGNEGSRTSGLKDMTNKPSDKRSRLINQLSSPPSSPETRSKAATNSKEAAKSSKANHVPSEKENSKATPKLSKKTSAKQNPTQKRKKLAPPTPQSESESERNVASEVLASEECLNGLRRSKRAKIGLGCHPKYEWEEMSGFDGNKVRVLCKVGSVPKDDLFLASSRKFIKSLEKLQSERSAKKRKERKKIAPKAQVIEEVEEEEVEEKVEEEVPRKLTKEEKKEQKKKLKYEAKVRARKEEKRRLRELEKEKGIRQEDGYTFGNGHDNIMNVDQHQIYDDDQGVLEKEQSQCTSQDHASLATFSQCAQSQINTSQDTIVLRDEKTNTNQNQRLYLFARNRQYQDIMEGVSVCIISKEQGIYRLDPHCYNSTSVHDQPINYHVEEGVILCSINGIVSRHTSGDIIKVPKDSRYKFKNASAIAKAYLHFTFLKK